MIRKKYRLEPKVTVDELTCKKVSGLVWILSREHVNQTIKWVDNFKPKMPTNFGFDKNTLNSLITQKKKGNGGFRETVWNAVSQGKILASYVLISLYKIIYLIRF